MGAIYNDCCTVKVIKISEYYQLELNSKYGACSIIGSFRTREEAEKEAERIAKKFQYTII